jgi:hypothetical protein
MWIKGKLGRENWEGKSGRVSWKWAQRNYCDNAAGSREMNTRESGHNEAPTAVLLEKRYC